MNEKKRIYANELDLLAEQFDADIINELKTAVSKIKDFYQITDSDLAELLDVDKSYLNGLFDSKTAAINLDLRTIALLTLLSNGRLNVLTDTPSGELYNKVNRVMKDFHDERYPEPKNLDINDKILSILNLFGVKNEEDLDHLFNAVKQVRGAINEYDQCHKEEKKNNCEDEYCTKSCCNKKEDSQNNNVKYVGTDGNFVSEKDNCPNCSQEECNDAKVKGSYYDSNKMDKPEQFEFTGNVDKLIPHFINFLNKII